MYEALATGDRDQSRLGRRRQDRPEFRRRPRRAVAQPQPPGQRRRPALHAKAISSGLVRCSTRRWRRSPTAPSRSSCRSISPRKPRIRTGWPTAVERLLSLGWPGRDEYFRIEAANQVDTLTKALREDNRARKRTHSWPSWRHPRRATCSSGLTWDGDADFDLVVDEPLGATASYQTPRTVFGGSVIKNGYGSHPEEVYVCPRAFDGDYTVRVSTIWTNPSQARDALDPGNDHARRDRAARRNRATTSAPTSRTSPSSSTSRVGGARRSFPISIPSRRLLSTPAAGASKNAKPAGKTKSAPPSPPLLAGPNRRRPTMTPGQNHEVRPSVSLIIAIDKSCRSWKRISPIPSAIVVD